MRLFKSLVKWSFLLALVAGVGGAIALVLLAKSKSATPVSVEEWPEVPTNPTVDVPVTF